jgi:hypothetical protein
MPLSPALNDFGSADSIVDRRIGTAFSYVQTVANAIKEVKYVAHYMESVVIVGQNFANEVSSNLTGVTVNNPTAAIVAFPSGVDISMVKGSSVLVLGVDGSLYMEGALTFTSKVTPAGLSVVLSASAGSNLQGRTILWNLKHIPVVV